VILKPGDKIFLQPRLPAVMVSFLEVFALQLKRILIRTQTMIMWTSMNGVHLELQNLMVSDLIVSLIGVGGYIQVSFHPVVQ